MRKRLGAGTLAAQTRKKDSMALTVTALKSIYAVEALGAAPVKRSTHVVLTQPRRRPRRHINSRRDFTLFFVLRVFVAGIFGSSVFSILLSQLPYEKPNFRQKSRRGRSRCCCVFRVSTSIGSVRCLKKWNLSGDLPVTHPIVPRVVRSLSLWSSKEYEECDLDKGSKGFGSV